MDSGPARRSLLHRTKRAQANDSFLEPPTVCNRLECRAAAATRHAVVTWERLMVVRGGSPLHTSRDDTHSREGPVSPY